jgi:hypothetical protein
MARGAAGEAATMAGLWNSARWPSSPCSAPAEVHNGEEKSRGMPAPEHTPVRKPMEDVLRRSTGRRAGQVRRRSGHEEPHSGLMLVGSCRGVAVAAWAARVRGRSGAAAKKRNREWRGKSREKLHVRGK